MKKILFLLIAMFLFTINGFSQEKPNAKILKDGNYGEYFFADTITGKTFIDKQGQVFPVYKTEKNKLYIWKKSSKTGKFYRMYLKVENQVPASNGKPKTTVSK